MFPVWQPGGPPGGACCLSTPVARPETAHAVSALRVPVERYVRRSGGRLVICDGAELAADASTLDALARLHLAGHRLGCRIRILNAPEHLRALAGFAGLGGVLLFQGRRSGVEAVRQSEEREQPRRVQEEHDPADGAVGDVEHLQ